jgi:error-prone DNA polymerase
MGATAALLNAQPMGFYAPAQIVRDAHGHDVEVRPACVNASRWDCTLEPTADEGRFAVRLGLRMVRSLANAHAASLVLARADRPFGSIDDLCRCTGVPASALTRLAEADAFRPSLRLTRREALWAIRALRDEPLPLFAAASANEADEPVVALRPMPAGGEVVEDYRYVGLSLRGHPVSFLRAGLRERRIVTCADAMAARDGRLLETAGLVLVRQRPGSAKGVMFITVEDETGFANLVVWPKLFERRRSVILSARMLGVKGRVQREGAVAHLLANELTDLLRRSKPPECSGRSCRQWRRDLHDRTEPRCSCHRCRLEITLAEPGPYRVIGTPDDLLLSYDQRGLDFPPCCRSSYRSRFLD